MKKLSPCQRGCKHGNAKKCERKALKGCGRLERFERGELKRKTQKKEKTSLKQAENKAYALFKQVVRLRDGNKCLICTSPENLNVHHYIMTQKSSGKFGKFSLINCITLCSSCHVKYHKYQSGDVFDRAYALAKDKVSNIDQREEFITAAKSKTTIYTLQDYEDMIKRLNDLLEENK